MNYKIFIIEDDPIIQTELKTLLAVNNYDVFVASNFENIIQDIKKQQPHLILLDIKLPNESGFSICSKIRSFSDLPIIFVTSCNTDMDELNSIMLGGDAFIKKPYNPAILLAKIASLLKKFYNRKETDSLSYQGAILKLSSSKIEFNDNCIDLTKNEFKILYYLFKNAGNICSKADIIEFLWDNKLYIDDNTLSVNINRIREKLSTIGLNNFIKTKYKQGYTL